MSLEKNWLLNQKKKKKKKKKTKGKNSAQSELWLKI